jgi:hypothetical protein
MKDENGQAIERESNMVLVDQDTIELDGADTSSEFEEGKILKPFDPSKIRVETKNTTMDTLIKRLRNDEIDLAPDFQRRAGIWKNGAQSRLIESMLIKIPLPAFYMDATLDDKWLVVDGLQRLTTLRRFVIDKELALCELEFLSELSGKKYDGLARSFQRRIEETEIVMYLIQPGTPPRVKFDIFRRINTGGAPLSSQEIRHALNQGKIIKILETLANSIAFKTATAYGVSPKRMDDRECVLRFLAFTLNPPDEYDTDNFDGFLNESMAHLNQMRDDELQQLKDRFTRAMLIAKDIFRRDAFRKRYHKDSGRHPINKALFESWSVNLGQLSSEQGKQLVQNKEKLIDNFIKLMNEREFDIAVTQGTGAIKRVRLRFKCIHEIIMEVLV